ncbi:MAG: hypothetical protein ACOY3J_01550 [Bacillota bacterium]|nr:hypothetical protein [Thermanaerosceptrum fracticalcis]
MNKHEAAAILQDMGLLPELKGCFYSCDQAWDKGIPSWEKTMV